MNQVLFIMAVLTVLAMPGPTNALFAASGASVGFKPSLTLPPAGICGYLVSINALDMFIGPVMAQNPLALPMLKILASLWLFYCALKLWRQGAAEYSVAKSLISPRQVFLTTLVNPKTLIFAFAIFPQGSIVELLPYFAEFCGIDLIVACSWIGVGIFLARSAGNMATPLRINRAAALGLGVFATIFASSAVSAVL